MHGPVAYRDNGLVHPGVLALPCPIARDREAQKERDGFETL
jgi:hypothetical protein